MIPLFKPYMPEKLPKLDYILHSGALAYGKWGHEFEKRLGEYIYNSQILATNSFNAAYQLAITTLGLQPKDEVIGSPMTCLASNQPFATQHVKVIWADIEPATGMIDVGDVRKKITPRTKAILVNHFCGYVGYVDEVLALAKEYGLYVIEDAIEGFGAEYKGKKVGNLSADVTVYSFQTVRLPNTIDGGAVSFKDKALYDKAVLVRDYGIDRPRFRDDMKEISPLCDIALPGYGATPSEINSYVGCIQMEVIDELLEKQQQQARKWDVLLDEKEVKPVSVVAGTKPNYWVYGVLAENKRAFMEEWRLKGYYVSGVHLPNTYYSVFGKQPELRGVLEFYSKYVALPCGWWLE